MESKYNLLTRLLKNIKNVVNPDGSVAGGGMLVVNGTYDEETDVEQLDASFNDIYGAVSKGKLVVHAFVEPGLNDNGFEEHLDYLTSVDDIGDHDVITGRRYSARFGDLTFYADSPDDPMDSVRGEDDAQS